MLRDCVSITELHHILRSDGIRLRQSDHHPQTLHDVVLHKQIAPQTSKEVNRNSSQVPARTKALDRALRML